MANLAFHFEVLKQVIDKLVLANDPRGTLMKNSLKFAVLGALGPDLADSLREIDGAARFCTAPAQATLTAPFAPWELRTLELTAFVPPDARPGQSVAFRMVQRAGYMVCGGYTLLAVVAS